MRKLFQYAADEDSVDDNQAVILRPILLNAEKQADTLDLIKELRKRLRDESAVLVRSGEHQPLVVYVNEDELPGASDRAEPTPLRENECK